jgi:hypothetical protein
LAATEDELEEAEERLAECVLDYNGECDSTDDLIGLGWKRDRCCEAGATLIADGP